jgi:hypothetical protein
MASGFDHEMGKKGAFGTEVKIPHTQKEHDNLRDKGYKHGHWMFKGNNTPVFVLEGDANEHNRLAKEGWSNELFMYSANGRDFHRVTDKRHFDQCRKMGFSGEKRKPTSGHAAASERVV